ncbi:hypothetical protein B0T10DRAFT_562513 [Thelonectria olida]|uniref:Uncharacterized protein n=1 Tax=Thelonectria olida TaxID=1576542 RepID=A0A9P8W3G0_9HYPO|nr:hypothetical protein B0T10DRAFT_562513 [Thelonectria olida]
MSALLAATPPPRSASVREQFLSTASSSCPTGTKGTLDKGIQNRNTDLGFPPSTDNWSEKAKRRKTVGTGRTRYLKDVSRRFKNGFQTGHPKGSRGPAKASA